MYLRTFLAYEQNRASAFAQILQSSDLEQIKRISVPVDFDG